MEETLRLSAALLDAALDTASHLIMVHAEDGEVLQVSRNWLETSGYSADEIPTLNHWLRLAHGSAWPPIAERIARLYGMKEPRFGGEFQVRTKAGDCRTWDLMSVPLPSLPDGRRVLLSLAVDVTPADEEVEQLMADKAKVEAAHAIQSRFLAAANHELRQPMQAIRLLIDALRQTGLSDEQKQIVEYLTGSSNSLSHLLDTLLDMSKLDAGIVKPTAIAASIHTIFRRIETELAPLALEKDLRFKLFMPRRKVGLRTDPNLLLVILRNLVGNAIKYTERGGVLLAARLRRNQLAIQVWDTGIGIAAADRPRIYDEFFQAATARDDGEGGLGLGLSIVKRLADLLDYDLDCRSIPERGSVFELRIPLVDMPGLNELPLSFSSATARFAGLKGRHCVLVDDDLLVSKALEFLFERLGVSVSAFTSAEDALAHPETLAADFFLSDLWLAGEMNGIEFLDRVQALSDRRINGLILTADSTDELARRLAERPWTALVKPFDLYDLLAAIMPEQPPKSVL